MQLANKISKADYLIKNSFILEQPDLIIIHTTNQLHKVLQKICPPLVLNI